MNISYASKEEFAGFWRRLIALLIDFLVVSLLVFPLAIILSFIAPKYIIIESPFTKTTTVLESSQDQLAIEKDVVFGVWSYFYEVQEMSEKEYKYGSLSTFRLTTYRTQDDGKISSRRVPVDSDTFKKRPAITSSNIEWIFIFLYWIILESSVWQASVGKRIMRIIVITNDGKRPTVFQCAVRNILKILSFFILLVGFLMVLFTSKKQTLHDKISGLLVAKVPK